MAKQTIAVFAQARGIWSATEKNVRTNIAGCCVRVQVFSLDPSVGLGQVSAWRPPWWARSMVSSDLRPVLDQMEDEPAGMDGVTDGAANEHAR